jgi:hypothetical protein
MSNSNLDYLGNALTANGISMIDEILITGTSAAGTDDILFTNRLKVSPVPNNGTFTLSSRVPVQSFVVYDMSGRAVYTCNQQATSYQVNLGNISKGTYFLKAIFADNEKSYTLKFLVD